MAEGIQSVLVVDDDDDVRENLVEILEREGFTVHSARNGKLALEELERCGGRCVVVLDLLMPEMDGYAFLEEQLKHAGAGSARPVIVLSAAQAVQEASKLPSVVAVLAKPFEVAQFVELVHEHASPIPR